MNIHKPFRIVLFSYDLLRLLFIVAAYSFFSVVRPEGNGGIFPYFAYMSSNVIFPLICFFLLIKPSEYRNFFHLYIAGKIIAVVLFYMWAFFSLPHETGSINRDNYYEAITLLAGVFFISLGDILSIFGIWVLNKENGGS